jgi:ribosomal protein L40E
MTQPKDTNSLSLPGICQDCGGRCDPRGSTRCRRCENRSRAVPDLYRCLDCGGRCGSKATRCRSCANDHRFRPLRESIPPPNPSGLCACGCGQQTPLATSSSRQEGYVKGLPLRRIPGHRGRHPSTRWTIDHETGCWNWNGHVSAEGYGGVVVRGRRLAAHRAVYEELRGPVPARHELHHRCHNRRCVNPDHVEPLTHTDHIRADRAKLTLADVRAIRASPETTYALARRYGVSFRNVQDIRNGVIWNDDGKRHPIRPSTE